MKELTNEILNKLIDNELNNSEIDELYHLIKQNNELQGRLKAHQMVDSVLKNLKIESAPENTTKLIMAKISANILVKERKNGLFKFFMSLFGIIIILILGFILFSEPTGQEIIIPQLSSVKNYFGKIFSIFSFPINTKVISIISSAVTVIVLVSGYFIFEQHRAFKNKLNSIL